MSAGGQRAEELQHEVKRQGAVRREEGGGGEKGGEGGEKGDVDDKEDEGENYCFSAPVF